MDDTNEPFRHARMRGSDSIRTAGVNHMLKAQ
jgi:hypothetical protein